MRQAYDRPTTRTTVVYVIKKCRRILKHVLKRWDKTKVDYADFAPKMPGYQSVVSCPVHSVTQLPYFRFMIKDLRARLHQILLFFCILKKCSSKVKYVLLYCCYFGVFIAKLFVRCPPVYLFFIYWIVRLLVYLFNVRIFIKKFSKI